METLYEDFEFFKTLPKSITFRRHSMKMYSIVLKQELEIYKAF
jgi:hypothetical protein